MMANLTSLATGVAGRSPIVWTSTDLYDFGASSILAQINSGRTTTGSVSFAGARVGHESPGPVRSGKNIDYEGLEIRIRAQIAEYEARVAQEMAAYAAEQEAAQAAAQAARTALLMDGLRGGIIGAIFVLALLIPILLVKAESTRTEPTYKTHVSVEISSIGRDSFHNVDVTDHNQGGSVPHLTIWDEDGHRIGRSDGDKNGHLNAGDIGKYDIAHDPDANAYATYLAIHMQESDAICISHIGLQQPSGLYFDWLGDIGYACGASWYYNAGPTNVYGYTPRCTWLDKDDSGGIKYSAMGIHLPDFVATGKRLSEYSLNPKTLCSSAPRFQMYETFNWDSSHSFYNPRLKYTSDGADVNETLIVGNPGSTKDGTQPPFKLMKAIPDWQDKLSTMFNEEPEPRGEAKRMVVTPLVGTGRYHPQHKNHLVSSDYRYHSAQELCKAEHSFGPDFINLREGVFCDMGAKRTWPLCDNDRDITDACFDYGNKTMRKAALGSSRFFAAREANSPPEKVYESENMWRWGADPEHVTLV